MEIIETEKPSFDILTLLMTFVFGDVVKSDSKPSGRNTLWGILKNGAQGGLIRTISSCS